MAGDGRKDCSNSRAFFALMRLGLVPRLTWLAAAGTSQVAKVPPIGPLRKKVEKATLATAEAFVRKTVAETLAQGYEKMNAHVEKKVEELRAKRQELRDQAQARCT